MTKLLFFSLSLLGLTAIICLSSTKNFAQSSPITVSISGIEYENTNLTSLKEAIKKTPKVSAVKSSFANDISTITVSYTGTAEELWEKIPAASKKNFKLSSMTDGNITLSYMTATKTTTNTPSNPTNKTIEQPPAKTKKDNCLGCVYLPICDFDYTRSFQGKEWKGIDYDGTIVYYRYDNGDLLKKTEIFDEYGISMGFNNELVLKCNANKGTKWELKGTSLFGENLIAFEVVERGPLEVDGVKYNDILKISQSPNPMALQLLTFSNNPEDKKALDEIKKILEAGKIDQISTYYYYANGKGLIKTEDKLAKYIEKLLQN